MTVMTKPNKRDVKKSTPLAAAEVVEVLSEAEEAAEDLADLNDMSYRELQAMAKDNGLKASGTRADLVERPGG